MAWIRGGRVGWRHAAALVAGFVLVAAASTSAAGPWKLEAGRTRGGLTLSAVSCTSPGWCAAVGYESDETAGLPSKVYAESGDGSAWTVAPSSGPKASWLTGRVVRRVRLVPGRGIQRRQDQSRSTNAGTAGRGRRYRAQLLTDASQAFRARRARFAWRSVTTPGAASGV